MASPVIDRSGENAMNTEQPRIEYSGEPGIWNKHMPRPGFSEDIIVPVDLIVPAHVAASAGRRGACLPGDHGRTAARKSAGVEGALVDHDPIEIASLESSDSRRMVVNVAGPAALLVAKVHKLGERLATPHRLIDKDAGDVFRLIEATPLQEMIRLMQTLLADDRPAAAATVAIGYVRQLFATALNYYANAGRRASQPCSLRRSNATPM